MTIFWLVVIVGGLIAWLFPMRYLEEDDIDHNAPMMRRWRERKW